MNIIKNMPRKKEVLHLSIPGHISAAEAAEMLGISYERVLQLIRGKRFTYIKVSKMYMIPTGEVEEFKKNPPGRVRKSATPWHVYNGRITVTALQISIRLRAGQQERFEQRVQQLHAKQQHTFKGSMIRLVWQQAEAPEQVTIVLVWKSNEMPSEETRQQELASFQHDFADLLDWDTAQVKHERVLLTT